MELAKRDLAINKINEEINKRKDFLNKKQKEIAENTKDNELLNELLIEYDEYININNNEKDAQIKALENMLNYIENIQYTKEFNKEMIASLKKDRKDILNEIQKIRG
jgi:hypothetical protein